MVQSASTAEPSSGRSSAASLTQERVPSSATGVEDEEEQGMCGLTDLVSHCLSSASGKSSASRSSSPTRGSKEETQPLLRASLFPNVPPTIRFYVKGTKVTKPTRKIAFRLAWCHNSLLPIVMRQSLATSHFTVVDENAFWIGYWGRHLKSSAYKYMHPYQKINHFPGAFHLGRKDRLSQHVERKRMAWGEDTFGLMPVTYVLPADIAPMKAYLAESPEHHVIVKPPASARGTGITVTRRLTEIPKKTAVIAQQYVDRPLTINGAKLDLRLYAYVSSLSPLRVYLYEEGLVRFASVPYSCASATASNRYVHLTNYSVNKFAEADGARDSPVPKWTLTQLWKHLTEEKGVDTDRLRENIEDLVVKTIIATEKPIREHTLRNVRQVFACHELFGFDVLLDADLRPWLLEVNISPSLHSGTKLDVSVKAPLAKDVLNLAGIHIPPDDDDTPEAKRLTVDYSARPGHNEDYEQTIEQRDKENFYEMAYEEQGLLDSVLEHLTPEDVRMLVDFEDELDRAGGFQLLFPRASSARALLPLFDEPHYPNLLLSRWQEEFGFCAEDRELGRARLAALCQEKYHQFRGAHRRRLPSVPAPRGVPKTPPTAVKVRDISSVPIPSVPSPPRSVDSSECSSTSDSPPLSGVL